MATTNWTLRQTLLQVVLPILALLVPTSVALWPYIQPDKKELTYEVTAVTPLGPMQAVGFSDLKLFKGDKPIDKPFLATIRIANSGDIPIEPSEFASPLRVLISTGGGIFFEKIGMQNYLLNRDPSKHRPAIEVVFLDARVAASNPSNIPVKLTVHSDRIEISPLLLNAGDEIVMEALVNGGPPFISAEGRIAGIKQIAQAEKKTEVKNWSGGLSRVVLFIAALSCATYLWLSIAGKKPAHWDAKSGWIAASALVLVLSGTVVLRQGMSLLGLDTLRESSLAFVAGVISVIGVGVSVVAIATDRIRGQDKEKAD